jgi:NADPH2:quinone reductase
VTTESGDAGSAAMGLAPELARVRSRILKLAQDGNLLVPMAGTFKFDDAPAAFAALTGPHPSGKLALVSER